MSILFPGSWSLENWVGTNYVAATQGNFVVWYIALYSTSDTVPVTGSSTGTVLVLVQVQIAPLTVPGTALRSTKR